MTSKTAREIASQGCAPRRVGIPAEPEIDWFTCRRTAMLSGIDGADQQEDRRTICSVEPILGTGDGMRDEAGYVQALPRHIGRRRV